MARWEQFGEDYPEIFGYLLGQVSSKFVADHRLMDLITLVNSIETEGDGIQATELYDGKHEWLTEVFHERDEAIAKNGRLYSAIKDAKEELRAMNAYNTKAYKILDTIDDTGD